MKEYNKYKDDKLGMEYHIKLRCQDNCFWYGFKKSKICDF
jgi:hypothetical protein